MRSKGAFADPLPAGTLLVRCSIPARAVPWSTPMIGRRGPVKQPRLVAWQRVVRGFASRLNSPIPTALPYAGPVEVSVVVRLARRPGPMADATNLLKAIEDAMEGSIYVNDRQVIRNHCERTAASHDLVTIEVRAADPPGTGEGGAS